MGKKKVNICYVSDHDWKVVAKCKDFLGSHPCKYFPEGCDTCLSRFDCYTKDSDIYRTRLTGIFYSCTKCPMVTVRGERQGWVTEKWDSDLDIRDGKYFLGMDPELARKLRNEWSDKEEKNGA